MKHAATLALCILLASPLAWNQPAAPTFEVASVKLHEFPPGMTGLMAGGPSTFQISGNRVTTTGSLETFIMAAHDLRLHQVAGGPQWRDPGGNPLVFDIQAKAEDGAVLPLARARQMMQSLLAERFGLQFHRETKDLPVYELTVDKSGPKLQETATGTETKTTSSIARGVWKLNYTNLSMADLATRIASNFDRPLLDKTGLPGSYDFTLEYRRANLNTPADDPSIFTALQQLGLKVIQAKAPVEIIVIDRAEKPSAN